jgi:16S rRNA (cytidine1402-2'-O)-methyltransferase
MPGTLHVIATPIGNLEDITLRAVRLLREVALVAAEDTRRTAKLLHHFGIQTPTISYHAHNHRARLPILLDRLRKGEDLGLVSDAGTPGLSDPGVELVDACLSEGVPVNPVPGPSALLAAVTASGFVMTPMTWLGFGPSRSKDLEVWLSSLAAIPHTVCFLEAPHRIKHTLEAISGVLGSRPIVLARELTKAHQEILRGPAHDVLERLKSFKGEFTLVVGPISADMVTAVASTDDEVVRDFGRLEESGEFPSRRALVTALARKHNRSSREIYALILEHQPGQKA